MKLKDLEPNVRNPRKISDPKLKMLAKSMKEFGPLDGVLFNETTSRLFGGHQRQKVDPNAPIVITERFDPPTKLGTTARGYIESNGEHIIYRQVRWPEKKELAGNIAANKGAGEWDFPELSQWFLELDDGAFDMDLTMFDEEEREKIIVPVEKIEPQCDEDEVPKVPDEPKTKLGDIYQLGNHRLMCGDSTSIDAVEKLMNGKKADMIFTDPPYGVSYQSNMRTKSDKFSVIENDQTFLSEWINVIPLVSSGWIFVWTTWKVLSKWLDITSPIGEMSNMIIWDKGGGGLGDLEKTFSTDYEIALVFNRGSSITGKRLGSVWSVGKDKAIEYVHPTQKPVELAQTALENCTSNNSKILDLFGGSGSTLIACEKTNRKCFMMELDPKYCDVIVSRWEMYTGKKAQLLNHEDDKDAIDG